MIELDEVVNQYQLFISINILKGACSSAQMSTVKFPLMETNDFSATSNVAFQNKTMRQSQGGRLVAPWRTIGHPHGRLFVALKEHH